jgi:hypothetical protein
VDEYGLNVLTIRYLNKQAISITGQQTVRLPQGAFGNCSIDLTGPADFLIP